MIYAGTIWNKCPVLRYFSMLWLWESVYGMRTIKGRRGRFTNGPSLVKKPSEIGG